MTHICVGSQLHPPFLHTECATPFVPSDFRDVARVGKISLVQENVTSTHLCERIMSGLDLAQLGRDANGVALFP
jgi:hypothetical protein